MLVYELVLFNLASIHPAFKIIYRYLAAHCIEKRELL